MGGTSIAAPSAAPWATDFLNAAYYARAPEERDVEDLRLAFAILTTRWDRRRHRRLRLWDLPAFHRAFGAARLRRRGRIGRLTHDDLLEGGDRLLGPWFSSGWAAPRRRGWGIVFESAAERDAYVPEERMRTARLGPLTPPRAAPEDREWHAYRPVPVADPDLTLARLTAPERWPDFGSDHGRFTPLRSRGLAGQTFEIEVVAGASTRHPMLTRGYVTATRVESVADPEGLRALIAELADGMARAGVEEAPLTEGHAPLAAVQLTTHRGHFIGAAISNLVLSTGPGGAELRDIGVWDPMPVELRAAYLAGGRRAQRAFWGEIEPENSMLHQFAAG